MKEFDAKYGLTQLEYYIKNSRPGSFNCPYLRVLEEDIKCKNAGDISVNYDKNSLMCLPQLGLSPPYGLRCSIDSSLKLTPEGELEARCSWNRSTFKFRLVDFVKNRCCPESHKNVY